MRECYQWERARFIAWYGALPYQKKGSSIQMEDILRLPTDPTPEEKEMMRQDQELEMKRAMEAVFDSYRKMGYSV